MKRLIALLLCALPLGAATVTLMWDASPGPQEVDGYRVYQSTNIAGPWSLVATTTATNVSLNVTQAAYFWYVTATNFWGESDPSNLAHTPDNIRSVNKTKVTRP